MKLKDKVAIVTGAASGIGRATATAFLEEGASVAFVDRHEAALARLRETHVPLAERMMTIGADATSAQDFERVAEAVTRRWGRIDILVNNVGGAIGAVGLDVTEADWDATVALSLKSHFLGCRAVAPTMRAQRKGRIICIASNAGKFRSNTGTSSLAYSAAKGGVLQLARTLAHELGPFGITVNAIAPGSVLSDAGKEETAAMPPLLLERVMRETALGYFAEPEEMASIAVFLASDDASYVTGATIIANGGWCTS